MDANRLDELPRALSRRSGRRDVVRRGSVLAAGTLGIGGARALAQDEDDEREVRRCQIAFRSVVAVGPSEGAAFQGILTLEVGEDGRIDGGSLETEGPRPYPVVGQVVGRTISLRVEIGEGRALALTGVGEHDVRECRGRLSGTLAGPDLGDLGAWEAEPLDPGPASPTAAPDDLEDIVDV